jgi:hypothetical protein
VKEDPRRQFVEPRIKSHALPARLFVRFAFASAFAFSFRPSASVCPRDAKRRMNDDDVVLRLTTQSKTSPQKTSMKFPFLPLHALARVYT